MKLFAYSVRTEFEKECVKKEAACLGAEVTVTEEYPCTENAELAKGYDGISIITNPLDAELLDRFYELGVRAVSTRSIGYEHIDVEYAKKLGMRVANVSYSPNSVANYTIMLMLMACRKLPYIMKKDEVQAAAFHRKQGGGVGIADTVAESAEGAACLIIGECADALTVIPHPGTEIVSAGVVCTGMNADRKFLPVSTDRQQQLFSIALSDKAGEVFFFCDRRAIHSENIIAALQKIFCRSVDLTGSIRDFRSAHHEDAACFEIDANNFAGHLYDAGRPGFYCDGT